LNVTLWVWLVPVDSLRIMEPLRTLVTSAAVGRQIQFALKLMF
jgi:hypothetical protein